MVRAQEIVGAIAVLVSCLAPVDAHAAWPRYPDVNVPIGTGTGLQVHPSILEDGTGGAFIAWHDNRGANYDIYMQRVSAAGAPLWTANGKLVCSAAGDQAMTQMVSDGAGGVIVAWYDLRAGNSDVYVQRLNANGVVQWTANGVALCTALGDQTEPNLVSDGQGGAIVAWADQRSGTRVDVYGRRVNAAGTPQWVANGVLVCGAPGNRWAIRLVPDGMGGAIVVWEDERLGGGNYDIFAQRLDGSGVPQWSANGQMISAVADSDRHPAIMSDGMGGAFIAWVNLVLGPRYLKMQRVSVTGTMQWSVGGVLASNGNDIQHSVQLASDGAGGAITSWVDYREGDFKVSAQRMSSSGERMWGPNGTNVNSASVQDPRLVSDGSGGAIITWPFGLSGGEIKAQRVKSTGAVAWASDGIVVTNAIGDAAWPRIATDGAGGAIVTWHETRSTNHDVYVQRVDHYGYLGNVEAVVTSVRDVLNDQGGKVKVSWNASYLDADPTYGITEYRLWRSVPQAVVSDLDAPRPARAMTRDSDVAAAGDALLLMSSAGVTTAWELAFFQPAAALPSYSMTTPTTGDSIAGSNPPTLFMVEARSGYSAGDPRWFSAPDSGYSVDNLAPAVPTALTGMYANGVTVLHWATNGEADLSNYRLYRGTSAGFTPSPANRIASPANTNYDDPSGVPYFYKLSAVDIHGNESGFALLTPLGTLDAPAGGIPVALRLGSLEPNPAEATTRIAFDLPRAAHVSLVVYDATGRSVRALVRGERPAGTFGMTWDLRNEAGHRVANGVYFVRLVSMGRALTRRMVVMR